MKNMAISIMKGSHHVLLPKIDIFFADSKDEYNTKKEVNGKSMKNTLHSQKAPLGLKCKKKKKISSNFLKAFQVN